MALNTELIRELTLAKHDRMAALHDCDIITSGAWLTAFDDVGIHDEYTAAYDEALTLVIKERGLGAQVEAVAQKIRAQFAEPLPVIEEDAK